MSRQSIQPVIQAVIDRVQSLQPTLLAETTFSCPVCNLGADSAEEWIEDLARETREFVVFVSGLPALSEANAPCHVRGTISVAVVYRADLPDDLRDVLIYDDCNTIISGVIARPDLWGGADGVWPAQTGASVATVDDAEGNTQLYVLTIPFDVWTH